MKRRPLSTRPLFFLGIQGKKSPKPLIFAPMNKINNFVSSALQNLKIEELNPMQESLLRSFDSGKDIVLLSPTGTGKTLAYLLPLMESLDPANPAIQALILVPSRELALQIESVFNQIRSSLKICSCYGGHPIADEKKSISGNHPAVIVGTPGRINDHLGKDNFDASTIRYLILDEFDKSLELGFQEEMQSILSYLPGLTQRILLSATDAEQIPDFTGVGEPLRLDFLENGPQESRLQLMKVLSPEKDKLRTLFRLLCSLGNKPAIVFANHREAAERISGYLTENHLYNEYFHGGMEQPDRERALYKFSNGSCHVLVATDLAARGLDIPDIRHIVHYHLPLQEDAFTHRNGRTARWDATGNSYVILHGEDALPSYIPEDIPVYELPEQTGKPPRPFWATLYIGKGKKR